MRAMGGELKLCAKRLANVFSNWESVCLPNSMLRYVEGLSNGSHCHFFCLFLWGEVVLFLVGLHLWGCFLEGVNGKKVVLLLRGGNGYRCHVSIWGVNGTRDCEWY